MNTRQALDRFTAKGCQNPGCDHTNHAAYPNLIIHSRCHIEAPMFLQRRGREFAMNCVEPTCMRTTLLWQGEPLPGSVHVPDGIFNQSCHPDDAVWASYQHGSGLLVITCYRCETVVLTVTVDDEETLE